MRGSSILAFLLAVIAVSVTVVSARPGDSPNKAATVMSNCVSKTRALHRFVCTMEVQILGLGNSPSLKRTEKHRVVMDGPRRIAVRELAFDVSGSAGPDKDAVAFPRYHREIIADGARYYVLDAYQRRYLLHGLHPKGFAGEQQSAGIFADYAWGTIILSGGSEYVSSARTSGKFMGEEDLNGIRCDKIHIHSNNMVYWIGQKDGLIRRVDAKVHPPIRIIENYTIHSIGGVIPPDEFAIKPPATAQRVDSL